MTVAAARHDLRSVVHAAFCGSELLLGRMKHDPDMVMRFAAEHPIEQDDIPGLRRKIRCWSEISDPAVSQCEFLPASAACQTAADTFLRAIRDLISGQAAAMVYKGRAPASVRLADVPLRKVCNQRGKIGALSVEISMKWEPSHFFGNSCQPGCRWCFHLHIHQICFCPHSFGARTLTAPFSRRRSYNGCNHRRR